MLAGLGVEPTGNALDGALLALVAERPQAPLKAALLDQRLIAGLGNIYVSEALWRAGLSPLRAAGTIAGRARRPVRSANAWPRRSARSSPTPSQAGGSSLRDYVHTDGSLGYFQHSFAVYDREGEPCPQARLRRPHRAHRAERPLDLLLPDLPDVS